MAGRLFCAGGQAFDYCVASLGFGKLMHKVESAEFSELERPFVYFSSILLLLWLLKDLNEPSIVH